MNRFVATIGTATATIRANNNKRALGVIDWYTSRVKDEPFVFIV
jgi:hypothetical protein